MLCLLASLITLPVNLGFAQTKNWDGDNAVGNFSFDNNWYGNAQPSWGYGGDLFFNYRNNTSQTSLFFDYSSWRDTRDIFFESTFAGPTTWNGNGNGINFMQRLENRSSQKVTFGTMKLSGGKNGASQIELNPVNGDMEFLSTFQFFNDDNRNYFTYGNNQKLLTIGMALGGGSGVSYSIEQYSKVYFTAAQTFGGSSSFNIKQGELWLGGSGGLASGMVVNLGLNDANTAKFYLTGANDSHNIKVDNSGGAKVLGSLGSSGIDTFSGNVTNNGGVLLENTSTGSVAFSGTISGAGSVTIGSSSSASGTVILAGANSFSGSTTVNGGWLVLSNNNALSNSSGILLGDTAGSSGATVRLGENITNSRSVTVRAGSSGTKTLQYSTTSGTGAQLGNITLNDSTGSVNSLAFNIASGGTLLFGGGVTANAGASATNRLAIDGGGTLIVTNNGTGISGSDRYQVRIGNGTLIIGAGTIISRTNFPSGPVGHALDLGVDLNGTIVNAASTLRASNSVTISNSIYVSTTSGQARTIGASGAGAAVTYSGRIDLADAALTVDSTNGQSVNVSGVIGNFSGTGALIKTGTGTATLSGSSANTYSGATTVSAGTLNLNKTSGNAIAGSVTVSSGATLLLSSSDEVADSSAVTLSGGTIAKGSGAISDVFGALNLSATSFVDFGSGTGNFSFATYNPSTFKLTFQNFNLGNSLTVRTGTFNASQFEFGSFGYSLTSVPAGGFTITAIPEPATILAALGLAGLLLWPMRRALRRSSSEAA